MFMKVYLIYIIVFPITKYSQELFGVSPWSEWSVCQGSQFRTRKCLMNKCFVHLNEVRLCNQFSNNKNNVPLIPSNNIHFKWRLKPSNCEEFCNKSMNFATVECIMIKHNILYDNLDHGQTKVEDSNCLSVYGFKPQPFIECQNGIPSNWTCRWETTEWSKCELLEQASMCDKEVYRTRKSVCLAVNNAKNQQKNVDDDFCQQETRPIDKHLCSFTDCQPRWIYNDWGPCSSYCGIGFSYRKVTCVNFKNITINENKCNIKGKPMNMQLCQNAACSKYKWFHSLNWTSCSELSNNIYIRTRAVFCMDDRKNIVNDTLCSNNEPKPLEIQSCHLNRFKYQRYFTWMTTEWSKCYPICNRNKNILSYKYRSKYCFSNDLQNNWKEVDRKYCSGQRNPIQVKQCSYDESKNMKTSQCHGKWIVSNWTNCSIHDEYQFREMLCFDSSCINDENRIIKRNCT